MNKTRASKNYGNIHSGSFDDLLSSLDSWENENTALSVIGVSVKDALREKCPSKEIFLVRIFPHSN